MPYKDNTIHLCSFCGEKTNGKLCPTCKTKEQRLAKIHEQLAIEKENGIKLDRLFMFKREELLTHYGIKEA